MTLMKLTKQEYRNLCNEDAGLCKKCKQLSYGVEPDARGYTCDNCEAKAVYGLEELAMAGLVEVQDE